MPREPRAPQGPREAGAEARAGAAGWCAVCLRGAARARLLRRRADEFFRTLKIRQSTAWLCSWCLAKIQSFMCLKKKALQSKQWLDSINDSYIFNVNEKYFVEKLKEIQGNNYRCTYFPVISLPHSNSTYVITIPSLDPMTAPPPHHETIRKCWGMSNYKPEQIYSKPASMNITRCWSKPSNQTFDEIASKSTDPDQDSVMRNIEFIKSKNETTCNQKYVKDANGQKINSDKLIDKNINITSKEYVENAIIKLFDQCSFSDMPADKNSLNSGVKVGSCFSISKGMCDEQKSSNTRLAPGSNDYVTNENIDIIIPNIFENQGIKTNFTPTDDEECGDSDITVAQQNSANTIVMMSERVHTSNITQNYSKTSGRWDKISSTNLQESKTDCIPTVIVKEECNDYDLERNDNKIGFRNLLPEVKSEKSKEDYIDDEDTWDAWSELGIEAVQPGLEKQENTSTSYEKTGANHNSHKDTKCFMQEHFLPNKICKRILYETGHYTSEVLPYNESISDSQDDDCDDLLVERILPYTNCIRKSLRCQSIQNIKQKQKIKQNEITADSIINEQNFFRVDSLDNSNGQKKRMVQHKTHAKNQQRTRILKKQKIRKKHDKKLAENISELHQKEGKKNLRVMVTPIKFESSLQARILRSRACLEKEQTETEKKNTPESCEDIDKIKCRNTTNVDLKKIYVEQILPKQNCTSNTACDDIETENQSELSERNEKDKKISTNGFQGECASLQGVALPINKIIVNDIVIQSNKKTKATKSGATLIISDNRTGRFCTSRGPYQCDFCEKLFTSKREVRMHLRRKHLTTCNQQQLQNKEKNSYTDDSQVVGGNTSIEQIVPNRNFLVSNEVECEETKKSFELCIILEKKKEKLGDEELSSLTTKQNKKPNELIKSIEKKKCKNCHITHTGRGPFICNVCNKVFTCKKYFQKHKRNMHATLVDASKNDIKKRIGTKGTDKFQSRDKTIRKKQIVEPYQCTVCMRIFKCRMYLTRHVSRLHSNDNKRYKCNICDSKFHQKWEIARHIVRTHGKKDCGRCSLKFRSKADLQKHYDCAHKNDTEHTPQDSKSHSQLPLAKKQYPVPGVRGEI